jgi:hypothetical protein
VFGSYCYSTHFITVLRSTLRCHNYSLLVTLSSWNSVSTSTLRRQAYAPSKRWYQPTGLDDVLKSQYNLFFFLFFSCVLYDLAISMFLIY